MLYPLADVEAALATLGSFKPTDFAFRSTCRRAGTVMLADSETDPTALVALRGTALMLRATAEPAREAAMRDLFQGAIAESASWLTDGVRGDWKRHGSPYLFVDTSPVQVWEAGLAAGFALPPDFVPRHTANLYWFEGQPRLSDELRHSCRLGRGMELLDRLREGIGYDDEGYYTRAVLQEQPSFVCEVRGEPVCWSTIHLNGTMGMIYTPPEHRRQGYARSLAAFQIDHVLRRHGFACCHVVEDNVASYSLLLDLGATKEDVQIVWRLLEWPDGTCPYSV